MGQNTETQLTEAQAWVLNQLTDVSKDLASAVAKVQVVAESMLTLVTEGFSIDGRDIGTPASDIVRLAELRRVHAQMAIHSGCDRDLVNKASAGSLPFLVPAV